MDAKTIMGLCVAGLGAASALAEPLALASVFTDHAVLQREVEVPVWGVAEPGTKVTVKLGQGGQGGQEASAVADDHGRWAAKLRPVPAGGPYELTVGASSGETLALADVLFGDVWICSGQSNMEMSYGWGLTRGKEDVENDRYPDIRLLNVPNKTSVVPVEGFGAPWKVCEPEAAKNFSAVGYFFGAALRKALPGVPIGLVDVTWSGTYIQTWLSLDRLAQVDGLAEPVAARRDAIAAWFAGGAERFGGELAEWTAKLDPFSTGDVKPFAVSFDDSAWKTVTLPASLEQHVAPSFDGVAWYRCVVDLTEAQAASEAVLSLGTIDDEDIAYVNGREVGATKRYDTPRNYRIPAGVLKPGANPITVRVYDTGRSGGFTGKPDSLALVLGSERIALAREWRYSTGILTPKPENLGEPSANSFSACYNGMFKPLFPMAVKGAIWYQGCSNVGGEELYAKLFPAMVADWRANLSGGDFPVYLVQLAAFQQTHPEPVESAWARMRWTMMQLGETVENSGTAVAIDVGHPTDIHPKDKKTVGERLARLALRRTYGRQDVVEAGPIPTDVEKTAEGIVVSFKNAVGLKTSDGGDVSGFQVVDAQGSASWARAAVRGEQVLVAVPEGMVPASLRFAWDDFPVCNLVNGEGLPCGPFRLAVQ